MKTRKSVTGDLRIAEVTNEVKSLKARYAVALRSIAALREKLAYKKALAGTVSTHVIEAKVPSGTTEATPILVASDWHIEEQVRPEMVSGLNEYNLDIARERGDKFFRNGLRLVEICQQDTTINTVVLALLGDFFSNDIHDELAEVNQLLPMDACLMAQDMIASGIQFLLDNSKFDIVIPTASGNHARTTRQVHISTEAGHSLEYMMYQNLASYFRKEPRVKFIIERGYHTYVQVQGLIVRFSHGHQLRYQGGIGGLYIPAGKALAQWNKAKRADLDIFGHFHSRKDGGNFISNGSMIGYNAYAVSIKADYEPPQQVFTLIDNKRGRTISAPILF